MGRKSDRAIQKTFFQMERFVQMNCEWFYATREGEERGPFENRSDAEGDLVTYIRHLEQLENFGVSN